MTRNEFVSSLVEEQIMPVAVITSTPFKTYYNRRGMVSAGDYESKFGPSMTIPDQSLSVTELVYRYTHGMPLGGQRTPVYDEDLDIQYPADWDKMDISERREFYEEKAMELQELQKGIKEKQGEIAKKTREDEVNAAVEAKLKAIREMRNPPERKQGELPLEE